MIARTCGLLCYALCVMAVSAAEPRRFDGVYPHLCTYTLREDVPLKGGDECGIGAVVPWAGKLYLINYGAHYPRGSSHSLYVIDKNLDMKIYPESVGGTPAGRLIHVESNQLFIGPYVIAADGEVRVIPPARMPGRITAWARHLAAPAEKVYCYDMEGMFYAVDVKTLAVEKLFHDPVPGVHGKGGYTAQGRVVIANNGRGPRHESREKWQVAVDPRGDPEAAGSLAAWDGNEWRIVERRQFTDVTGPGGIRGAPDDDAPLWAIGWDRRSLRLKLLDGGRWYTYLLPKAQHCNDPAHGWFTEWPRIRDIGGGRYLMDMHGMFFDFPGTFSRGNTAGIKPVSSHLRYIPDFCAWNGRLVLATDETTIMGNPLAGQPQSNLWFGRQEDLAGWGPAAGWGGPWVGDRVDADTPSDPFLVDGFDRRVLHLAVGAPATTDNNSEFGTRCTGRFPFTELPGALAGLARVTVDRGDYHKPAPGYSFTVDRPVTVYLAVDRRGDPDPGEGWEKTDLSAAWGTRGDIVYTKSFQKGVVAVPPNETEHKPGDYGLPHTAFVKPAEGKAVTITDPEGAPGIRVVAAKPGGAPATEHDRKAVTVTLEIDARGDGAWKDYRSIAVKGYTYHIFPDDFDARWIRLTADRDCTLTAYFHFSDTAYGDWKEGRTLFGSLADVAAAGDVNHALLYPAKRNRNLRIISGGDVMELTGDFSCRKDEDDPKLRSLLAVKPRYAADDRSVIVADRGTTWRLPKVAKEFDRAFDAGWPRGVRECESERYLGHFCGTFYEIPRGNGHRPSFDKMRPVSTHRKAIADYCTWKGLLVLSGAKKDAADDPRVVASSDPAMALWFGGIDELWKLGKPRGYGGPWKETAVKAGKPSDPYLMTNYDRKKVTLTADRDVTITLEVDVDHQTGWYEYRSFDVKAGVETVHAFEDGYAAHWIRAIADGDCTATAWFEYK